MKCWEIIAGHLSKAGWWVATVDERRRRMFVADAHRDGQRSVVRADEKLSAFMELESVIQDGIF